VPVAFIVLVLGLARTGLIFTGLQEGTQPGRLTPPGQTEPGIPYHVLSCWVPVGGSWGVGTPLQLGRAQWRFSPRERFCSARLFCVVPLSLLLLFPLFVVLLNCPYPDPPVFCLFSLHSPPHPGRGRGGCVALLLLAAAKPEQSFTSMCPDPKPQLNISSFKWLHHYKTNSRLWYTV